MFPLSSGFVCSDVGCEKNEIKVLLPSENTKEQYGSSLLGDKWWRQVETAATARLLCHNDWNRSLDALLLF